MGFSHNYSFTDFPNRDSCDLDLDLDLGLSIYAFLKVPWLPELFAMAEDMKVLEGRLADGGLEASSDEVEAYKYTYRY